jgi:CBS domain-containing protein
MATLKDLVGGNRHSVSFTTPCAMVSDAVERMCREHVRTLLVVDGADPVGIISERDVLERVIRADIDPRTMSVEAAMTAPLVFLLEDCTPSDALAFMRQHRLHQVPIFANDTVVGIVSSTDLMRWATIAQETEIRELMDYCCGRYPG